MPDDPQQPFYTPAQRALQDAFDSRALADTLEAVIVTGELPEDHARFIAERDFFFLSTVNDDGEPTVSYKGGPVGLVTVIDASTLAFPNYDGNGMFLSMGNVASNAKIGLLFIDMETPHRVRVQATASESAEDPLMERYPGANLIVRASVDSVFVNCGRYIHTHQRVASAAHVPDGEGAQPVAAWKRIDVLQDALPDRDRSMIDGAGGTITLDDYAARLAAGEP